MILIFLLGSGLSDAHVSGTLATLILQDGTNGKDHSALDRV